MSDEEEKRASASKTAAAESRTALLVDWGATAYTSRIYTVAKGER